MKYCTKCNQEFIPDRKTQRFCSFNCKVSFFNDLKRKEPKKEVSCIICQKAFMTYKQGHKCCSQECRHTYYLNNSRKRWREIMGKPAVRNNILARSSRNIPLTEFQKEIIYGSILGDSSLALVPSNQLHSLHLGHSEKQLDYLIFKGGLLNHLFQAKPNKGEPNSSSLGGSPYYTLSSISHGGLTSIYGIFYRNNKRFITYRVLNLLTPTSLLIWYLDDGCKLERFNACKICTNRYSLSEVKMMSNWFWKKFKIKTTAQQCKKKSLSNPLEIKTYYNLYFLKESTEKFFELLRKSPIYESLPDCMKYKLYKKIY